MNDIYHPKDGCELKSVVLGRTASKKKAASSSNAAACSLHVVIEGGGLNSRIQIKVAHQSFALEYQNDEPGAMEWFAAQLRSALAKAGTNVAKQ